MKKLKKVAACLVLSLGVMSAGPLWASDVEIKTNLFTLEQIRAKALESNQDNETFRLNEEMLKYNANKIYNSEFDVTAGLNSLSGASSGLAALQSALADAKAALAADPSNTALQQRVNDLTSQVLEAQAGASSAYSSANSLISTKQELSKQGDRLDQSRDDLKRNKEDFLSQVSQTATLLTLNAITLDKNIELAENAYKLQLELQKLTDLKKSMGMAIETEIQTKVIDVSQSSKQMIQMKNQYAYLTRQINDLIGRPLYAPLDIVPFEVSEDIALADTYTETLTKEIINKNYNLFTLQRDIDNLEEDARDTDDSVEKDIIGANIELKKVAIKDKEAALVEETKSKLQQINQLGQTYREAILTYEKEVKNFAFAEKKLELGLISPLEMKSAEITIAQAEATKLGAGYDYYIAKEEFRLMKQGVDLTSYNGVKGSMSGF